MTSAWRLAISAVVIGVGFLMFWYLAPRNTSFGMFEGVGGSMTVRLLLSFAATLGGVVLGSLYRALRELQTAGVQTIASLRAFFGGMAHSIDLWLGLAGAPLVYVLLLNSSDGMSLPGLLVVAIENGFCCLVIVNGFVGRVEQQQAPTSHG